MELEFLLCRNIEIFWQRRILTKTFLVYLLGSTLFGLESTIKLNPNYLGILDTGQYMVLPLLILLLYSSFKSSGAQIMH